MNKFYSDEESHEIADRLKEVFDSKGEDMTAWEVSFCESIMDQKEQYGSRFILTEKQKDSANTLIEEYGTSQTNKTLCDGLFLEV